MQQKHHRNNLSRVRQPTAHAGGSDATAKLRSLQMKLVGSILVEAAP
jgi:hypothetical protein